MVWSLISTRFLCHSLNNPVSYAPFKKLAQYLTTKSTLIDSTESTRILESGKSKKVLDGSALLLRVSWNKKTTFADNWHDQIYYSHLNNMLGSSKIAIIFDGYLKISTRITVTWKDPQFNPCLLILVPARNQFFLPIANRVNSQNIVNMLFAFLVFWVSRILSMS